MNQRDLNRLAAEVGCTERTVRRWVAGKDVSTSTKYALEMASKRLRIALDGGGNEETA
jgi:hypothetical protein